MKRPYRRKLPSSPPSAASASETELPTHCPNLQPCSNPAACGEVDRCKGIQSAARLPEARQHGPSSLVNTIEALQPNADGWYELTINEEVRKEIADALWRTRSSAALTDRGEVALEFWRKHALGSMLCPSCFMCGQQRKREDWAITHAELPDIYICKECVTSARSATGEKMKAAQLLRNAAEAYRDKASLDWACKNFDAANAADSRTEGKP